MYLFSRAVVPMIAVTLTYGSRNPDLAYPPVACTKLVGAVQTSVASTNSRKKLDVGTLSAVASTLRDFLPGHVDVDEPPFQGQIVAASIPAREA